MLHPSKQRFFPPISRIYGKRLDFLHLSSRVSRCILNGSTIECSPWQYIFIRNNRFDFSWQNVVQDRNGRIDRQCRYATLQNFRQNEQSLPNLMKVLERSVTSYRKVRQRSNLQILRRLFLILNRLFTDCASDRYFYHQRSLSKYSD